MALKIYGPVFSPYVARVVIAAAAKGMKYVTEMPEGGTKTPEYLKLNPFGKVPVLIDGATTLFESGVIIAYLDAKGKTKPLVPKNAKGAGQVRLIAAVAAEYVQDVGLRLFRHWRSKSTDTGALNTIKADLTKYLDVLEKIMLKGKYAAGSKLSLADVYAAPALLFVVKAGALAGVSDTLGKHKKVKAYWAALQKDKVIKPILDKMDARLQQIAAEG